MNTFERCVTVVPSFDKRDPNPSKNYGIGSCRIHFALIGPDGAVTFSASTGWYLPKLHRPMVQAEAKWIAENPRYGPLHFGLTCGSLDYHRKTPRHEGQEPRPDCEYTGGDCYCDGSATLGETVEGILVKCGTDALWPYLEMMYAEWIGTPAEVPA